MHSIGFRLESERKRLGLDIGEMADRLKIHRNTQSKYEKGERSPDADYLQAAADVGVDIVYVLTGKISEERLPPDEQALLGAYRLMAEETRASYKTIGTALAQQKHDEKAG